MNAKTTILTMAGWLGLVMNIAISPLLAIAPTNLSNPASSKSALSNSVNIAQTSNTQVNSLPKSVGISLRQDMAKRLNLKPANVQIIRVEKKVFDGCLNLPKPQEKCQEIALQGWAVTMTASKQRWVYHAVPPQNWRNSIRINWLKSLPDGIRQTAIQQIQLSLQNQQPSKKITVTSVEPRVWKNDCLDLKNPFQKCRNLKTPGWLIRIKNHNQDWREPEQWIFRSDLNGKKVEFDVSTSLGKLPDKIINDILNDAAKRSQINRSQWKLHRVEIGYYPSRPIQGAAPQRENTYGWQVSVTAPGQKWVYYTTSKITNFDAPQSIPDYLKKQAIAMAAKQSGLPTNTFRFHWGEYVMWNDTCLGITINKPACEQKAVPGWQIQIMGINNQGSTLYNFHSRLDTDIRFNGSHPWFPPPSAPRN